MVLYSTKGLIDAGKKDQEAWEKKTHLPSLRALKSFCDKGIATWITPLVKTLENCLSKEPTGLRAVDIEASILLLSSGGLKGARAYLNDKNDRIHRIAEKAEGQLLFGHWFDACRAFHIKYRAWESLISSFSTADSTQNQVPMRTAGSIRPRTPSTRSLGDSIGTLMMTIVESAKTGQLTIPVDGAVNEEQRSLCTADHGKRTTATAGELDSNGASFHGSSSANTHSASTDDPKLARERSHSISSSDDGSPLSLSGSMAVGGGVIIQPQ
jgi:hypothetical protein